MGEAAAAIVSSPPLALKEEPEEQQPSALFHRRIEFHLARRPFNGFSSNGDKGGFQLETLNPGSTSGTRPLEGNRGSDGQKGKKELVVEYGGLDPELSSFRINLRRIGAGLQNLGNTCFLNSVLQCLTYTEPLAAYLQSGKHQNSCRTAGFCALCAIQKHVSRALSSTGRILAPKDLVSNLRCISRSFRNARQEDAHEYMVNLLESMHRCCLPSGVPSESPSAYERSLVHKIFGGRLCSQVKCMQCSYCSNKFDPFLDLSLEINKADSLHKALAHFTAKEQLDGGERQYQCQQCKQKVRALKQLTIFKPPHVLAVHLKRFGSHVPGQKIDKKIAFGPTLDLKPFVTGPHDGDLKYTLYGVLVHAGWSTHSGHYYCFVRTSSGMWYSLDDNRVVQVNERKVLEQKAYMLFYVRDQRNFVTKKPSDVPLKENMVMSAMGSKGDSKYNLRANEAMQNGPSVRETNISCSRGAAHINILNAIASTVAPTKEGGTVENNGPKADQLPMDAGAPSIVLLPQNSVVPTSAGGECLEGPGLPLNACDGKLDNVKATDSVENGPGRDSDGSLAKQSDENGAQVAKKARTDSCQTKTRNGDGNVKKTVIDAVDRSRDVNILRGPLVEVTTTEKISSQKEGIPSKLCGDHVPAGESTLHVDWRARIPSQAKAQDKKSLLEVKGKRFKSSVPKLHLSTRILFGTTLTLRKRKKHKSVRRCNQKNKNSRQFSSLEENSGGTDPCPSFSRESNGPSVCSGSTRKNKVAVTEAVPRVGLARIVDEEFRSRVAENGSLLSTEKRQTSPSLASAGHVSHVTESYSSNDRRKNVNQNSRLSYFETAVPRWDDEQLPQTKVTEAEEKGTVSIGFIGDEWDEEYDRGKRKKVRGNKVSFGGPNPFQVLSNRKAKRKRMDRSSGNVPFRI